MSAKLIAAERWDGRNEGKIVQLGARVNIIISTGALMVWSGGDWVDVPIGSWVAIDEADEAHVVEQWDEGPAAQ